MSAVEAGDRRTRGELESEIASVETSIEELSARQQEISNAQQNLNLENRSWADGQSIRRAEIQGQIAALEPKRQSQFSALSAREAQIASDIQRLQRDAQRPPGAQQIGPEERMRKEEELLSAKDDLVTERARVEDEFARRTAALQEELAQLDVEATKANRERGQQDRDLQEALAEVNGQLNGGQRRLTRLREALNTLLTEEAAHASTSEAEQLAAAKAREMEAQLEAISADRDRLAGEVQDLAPLVEAQRDATSAQGAENLGGFYSESADGHRTAWIISLVVLLVAVAGAAGLGLYTVNAVSPNDHADAKEIFHSAAVAILVIGLLLYVVRIASLQFRVHRNLEAVDRSKAAALRTYSRLVAAANSPEVRNALVSSLADAVFRTPETGFIDQSADHITLIERIAGSVGSRVPSAPG